MKVFKGEGFGDVYKQALYEVNNNPEFVLSPRGMKCKELTDVALVIENPLLSLYDNERRSSQKKYIAAEILWYASGSNTVEWISKYAKMWDSLKDKNGMVNSAYGNLIFTEKNDYNYNQYNWAFKSLVQDPDTRQAIMHFNKPHHQYDNNKDFVCTLNAIFQIRNNKLNMTVDMRSNDIILGLSTDVAFFTILQQQMLMNLKEYGECTNNEKLKNLKLGRYTHIDHSLHLYERHFDLVDEMLKHNFVNIEVPTLDCPLICFKDSDIKPYTLVEFLINKIVNNKELELPEIQQLTSSRFYITLVQWLNYKNK
ncbi:thymidylate synthase [uncultured Methanobrevibacter sp.]|uniref:thymidylate synthase n=1 Tax=uncultured Methanobrevibacter sp. TaxID=253161 RepID=UPI0025F64BDA|nr:thymidylate synthase [uncultured Methanobrevibacter sp.]